MDLNKIVIPIMKKHYGEKVFLDIKQGESRYSLNAAI